MQGIPQEKYRNHNLRAEWKNLLFDKIGVFEKCYRNSETPLHFHLPIYLYLIR